MVVFPGGVCFCQSDYIGAQSRDTGEIVSIVFSRGRICESFGVLEKDSDGAIGSFVNGVSVCCVEVDVEWLA